MVTSLLVLYTRDLNLLKSEISLYKSEANMWRIDGKVINSGGNLCLHLVGNINHFIGATLGKTGYVREREKEFVRKDFSRDELLMQISDTQKMLSNVLLSISEKDLHRDYPLNVFGQSMTTQYFLLHLVTHLNYHLGQINYHRKLLDV